mmetsp:Transcript_82590/g.234276  ORF Transcript_82590/g.234276 Transcript_82590/m.234276 type:complete len:282 (+) Transcript_82590:246-1091(+)
MHLCRMASGTISQSGPCRALGGSEVRMQRKSGCAKSSTSSRDRSSVRSQACMRWMFWSMTQPPSLAASVRAPTAACSWPWPMEMSTRPPPPAPARRRARASTAGVGSAPGRRTKKRGVRHVDSSKVRARSRGSCSTKSPPRLSTTNCVSAAPMRSGRRTRSRKSRWKAWRSRQARGRSAVSARSSANQRFQPSESCSRLCVSTPYTDLKVGICSRLLSCAHCSSASQLRVLSGHGGGRGSGGARIRRSSSDVWMAPERTRTRSVSIVATVSLSASRRPLPT